VAVALRTMPRIKPSSRWLKLSKRLSVGSRAKAPVPYVTEWLSWAETAITAVVSSGGGSVIKAQAVYPR
jgi:hypothetical protein